MDALIEVRSTKEKLAYNRVPHRITKPSIAPNDGNSSTTFLSTNQVRGLKHGCRMNPKAITTNDMYGRTDPASQVGGAAGSSPLFPKYFLLLPLASPPSSSLPLLLFRHCHRHRFPVVPTSRAWARQGASASQRVCPPSFPHVPSRPEPTRPASRVRRHIRRWTARCVVTFLHALLRTFALIFVLERRARRQQRRPGPQPRRRRSRQTQKNA